MAVVREVTYEDVDGVAAIHRTVGWGTATISEWKRRWVENPALREGQTPKRGWVLEHDSRIVGSMSNVAQVYRLGERCLRAAAASEMVVAPEFRGEAMKLVMAFAQQPHVDLLLNTTAGPQSSKIFEFFKFRRIPQPDYDKSLFWILRSPRFAAAALRKRGWPAPVSRVAGPLVAPAVFLEGLIHRRRFANPAADLHIAIVKGDEAGAEFDELWRRSVASRHQLLADRSGPALRWHYAAAGRPHPARLVGVWSDEHLMGFASLVRRDSPHIGLARTYIADIFVEDDDPRLIRQLIAAGASQARADGAAMLQAVGFPERIRAVLGEARPFVLRHDSWPFLYRAKDPALHRRLDDPTLWHACLYDGDGTI